MGHGRTSIRQPSRHRFILRHPHRPVTFTAPQTFTNHFPLSFPTFIPPLYLDSLSSPILHSHLDPFHQAIIRGPFSNCHHYLSSVTYKMNALLVSFLLSSKPLCLPQSVHSHDNAHGEKTTSFHHPMHSEPLQCSLTFTRTSLPPYRACTTLTSPLQPVSAASLPPSTYVLRSLCCVPLQIMNDIHSTYVRTYAKDCSLLHCFFG